MSLVKPTPTCNWFPEEEEEQLVSLLADTIDIGDIGYGLKIALKQKDLEAAAEK